MAKDTTVSNSANKINESIKNATNTTINSLNDLNTSLTGAVNSLGDGIKLTAKSTSSTAENFKKIKEELNGLRVFCPEFADMAETLIAINSDISLLVPKKEDGGKETEKDSDENEEGSENLDIAFDTSAKETGTLAGLTTIENIAGTGFSIVGNLLKDLYELFSTVLQSATPTQLSESLIEEKATIEKKKDEAGEKIEKPKGVLSEFFQGISGPLESIAGSTLLLATSLAILSTIQLDSQLIGVILILETFMITTFAALQHINSLYQEQPDVIDTEGNKPGSITSMMKDFTKMILLVSASLVVCNLMTTFLQENWQNTLTGLVLIFGITLTTMIALSVVSAIISELASPGASIQEALKSFTSLVFLVTGVAIVCSLLWPIILDGLQNSILIFSMVAGIMLFTSMMLSSITLKKEELQEFNNIIKSVIALVSIVSVLSIVLGVIPIETLTQGLVSMTLIVGLISVMFIGLGSLIEKASKVPATGLESLTALLITSTVLVGLISVLVIVLGSIEITQLMQGFLAMTLVMTFPLVMVELLSKVGKQNDKMVEALLGVKMAGILTLAISGIAFLIVSLFANLTIENVFTAALAITLVSGILIGIGAVAVLLAGEVPTLQTAIGPALIGIGISALLAGAVAGVAFLLAKILSTETAESAVQSSIAIVNVMSALIFVGVSTVILASMAGIIGVSALIAVGVTLILGTCIPKIMKGVQKISKIDVENIDSERVVLIGGTIHSVAETFAGLAMPLIEFNLVGLLIASQLLIAGGLLATFNVGMLLFATNLNSLNLIVSILPTEVNMKPISSAILEMNEISSSINSFVSPDMGKLLSMSFTLGYITNFAKKLSNSLSDSGLDKITGLANSLSALAQNSTGLQNLAGAIKAVAEATNELNSVSKDSKISVEAISGNLGRQATELAEVKKPMENKKDNSPEILQKLTTAVDTLSNILDNLSQLSRDTTRMADVQVSSARVSKTAYMS